MTDKREQLAAMIDPEAFEGLNEDDASVFNWLTNDRRQAAYDTLDRMLALIAEPDQEMVKAAQKALMKAIKNGDVFTETDIFQAMIGVLQREER